MNKIKTLTLAGLIGLIAMAAGTANPAVAQTGGLVGIDFRPIASDAPVPQQPSAFQAAGQGAQKVVPNRDFMYQEYGDTRADQGMERGIIAIQPGDQTADAVGRKAGDSEIKGFHWGVKGVGTPDTMPTDQMPADQKVQKVQKVNGLDNLRTLGGSYGLFANSKGGDQGNGLLLPAVRGGGTQQAHGAGGGGGAGKVQMQDFHFVGKQDAAKGLTAAQGAGGGGAGKVGDSKAINFTNTANTGAGTNLSPGTTKGFNFMKR